MTRRVMQVCAALLCLLYGISAATHLLAFLGLYRLETFLIAAPLAVIGAAWLYTRTMGDWQTIFAAPVPDTSAPLTARARRLAGYDRACLIAALILLTLIFILRVSLFPWSNVGDLVSEDAIAYHFPKAWELVRTGTLWDVSFLYAEYPIGYEGLIAGGILLSGTVFTAGLIQAITIVLLMTTLALLVCRYSPLPVGVALLLVTLLALHPSIYGLLLLIGKNDLLMTTAILVAVLHAPLGRRGDSQAFHIIGMAFATFLAMSVKATAFLPLALLWALVLWERLSLYQQIRKTAESSLPPVFRHDIARLLGLTLLMLPCGFWLIRNLVMMRRPFSPEVSRFFQGSLLANLTFPKLYSDGPESLMLITLAVWGLIFIGLAAWRGGLRMALLLAVFWVGFLITPLGAFHTPERHTVRIEWRYITHLFLFMAVLVIAAAAPLLNRLLALSVRKPLSVYLLLVAGCGAILVFIDPVSGLMPRPSNAARLANPYSEANETGFVSGYDYVRRTIMDSVVYYNGIQPFYFYAPHTTNQFMDVTPHPLGMPDLVPRPRPDVLVHSKVWHVAPQQWPLWDDYAWRIVYEDSLTVVYQRE